LKMMGAESHTASSESVGDAAQVSAGRGLNSAQNSWQEVRRPQASSAQTQANQPQAQNEAGSATASATQANAAAASAAGYAGSSPQALPQKRALPLTQAKNSAQDVAVNADAQSSVRDSGQGKLAEADVPAASKKHRRAELHKKNRGGSLASSQTSDSAKGQSKNAALREADATSGGPDSASATENVEATADAEPSLASAQQKLTQPRQKVALRQGKLNKAPSAESHGAKVKATTLVAKGKGPLTSDERSILSAPGQHYTLQLMGSGSKATLQKLIASQHLQQKARIYHTTVKGKDFYGLIYGSYPSQAAANAAIAHLPASVQQLKPWAKPYASVKASINLAASQPTGKRTG
jgi:DamX protein